MKNRYLILCLLLLGFSQVGEAIPAKRSPFVKVQPDGSSITLVRHGDEFLHWTTTEDGTVMALDIDGYYKPASLPSDEALGGRESAASAAAAIRARRAASAKRPSASGYTTYHFPVVLVQFSDVKFSVDSPNDAFSRLLNQEGYSDNGGTGSVHDFYWENSMHTFNAVFDVYGPYTYNGTCAANADEEDAAKILWAAVKSYDSQVDWSQYDNDGDGTVDMVFMYYAGYNEAEGADNTIWPHKYNFSSAGTSTSKLDGKSFDIYACTSELKGTSGAKMCGIGTCAHEFSHTQGLPDFYDVNYDNYGDGEAGATYDYDIMCSGGYNNQGRTPPYFTAEERIMMGWLSGYTSIPSSGDIVIPSVDNNFAYKMMTDNTSGDGEYFVFECRSGKGWDAYVEPGLIVYHVDKSTKYTVTFKTSSSRSYNYTPYQLWSSAQQYINASGSHPCFYIVPAADQSNLNYTGASSKLPFPGKEGVSFYSPKDWSGKGYDLFSDISFHAEGSEYGQAGKAVVSMTKGKNYRGVCGFVKNSAGEPIKGAMVNIYSNEASASKIQKISGRIIDNLQMGVTTDENGYYSLSLETIQGETVDIEVVARGYISKYQSFSPGSSLMTKSFTMRSINEPIDYTLRKYDLSEGNIYSLGYGQTCQTLASVKFTADELSEYVGRKILKLGLAYALDDDATVASVHGLVEFGTTRKMTKRLSSPSGNAWNVVDVSGEDLYIPEGQDCYFGYALVNCTDGYPMLFSENNPKEGAFNYALYSSTSVVTSQPSWNSYGAGNLLIYVELDDSTEVDYNYIYNPGYGRYDVGDTFALRLIEAKGDRKPGSAIQWFFDDDPVSGDSVVLKYAGSHVVEARFTTADGKTKVVDLELEVGL